MTISSRVIHTSSPSLPSNIGRLLAGSVILAVIMIALFAGNLLERLGTLGYSAVFIVSLISNAAVFLPGPGIAVVIAAGATLDPILVGIVAGTGAALGELTGFYLGQSGQTMVAERPLYKRLEKWMRKCGSLVIFILAAIPNPFFDIGGLLAGGLRMPVWRFLLSVWLGKSIRFALLAGCGTLVM